jgi:hypothetical protein
LLSEDLVLSQKYSVLRKKNKSAQFRTEDWGLRTEN